VFELGHALAERGVLGPEPGDCGGGLLVAPHTAAGDAAPRRADALRLAARQGAAADRAVTDLWRRTYITRRDFGSGDKGHPYGVAGVRGSEGMRTGSAPQLRNVAAGGGGEAPRAPRATGRC
jgi:hypothetical protein